MKVDVSFEIGAESVEQFKAGLKAVFGDRVLSVDRDSVAEGARDLIARVGELQNDLQSLLEELEGEDA